MLYLRKINLLDLQSHGRDLLSELEKVSFPVFGAIIGVFGKSWMHLISNNSKESVKTGLHSQREANNFTFQVPEKVVIKEGGEKE